MGRCKAEILATAVTYRLRIEPRAETEIGEIAVSYQAVRPGHGTLFLVEVDRLAALILAAPHMHGCINGAIRRGVLHRFPYNLYHFVHDNNHIADIIGCIHGRAGPNASLQRLAERM